MRGWNECAVVSTVGNVLYKDRIGLVHSQKRGRVADGRHLTAPGGVVGWMDGLDA
jgi:hypothetical protein